MPKTIRKFKLDDFDDIEERRSRDNHKQARRNARRIREADRNNQTLNWQLTMEDQL